MAIQTCMTCKGTRKVQSVWAMISVVYCDSCVAAGRHLADAAAGDPVDVPAEEVPAVLAADDEFDAILRLEAKVNDHRITAEVGHTQMARNQGRHDWKAARRNLHVAIDRLSLDRLRAFGDYRRAARDGRVR